MKKLMTVVCAAVVSVGAFAADASKTENNNKAVENDPDQAAEEPAPRFWGFASYGIYSGYQLYGSIVNTEPTLQGYGEINANLNWDDTDLGFFGFGLWNNSDLTGKRNASYRRAFNEFDFNLHWQKTFWFDDDRTWGLTYRSYVVWYYYPWTGASRDRTYTTFDWDHYFELANPYLIPYVNYVHEYAKSYANLLQFGVKKPFANAFGVQGLTLTPFIEFVWRDNRYNWCFTNYGNYYDGSKIDAGLATMKLELDATYMFNSWIGVFAKVAYCQNLSPQMRETVNYMGSHYGYGEAYGRYNEFCWGGVGVCVNF